MEIVKTYEEGEYTINEYDNGVTERYLTEFPPVRGMPQNLPVLTEDQEIMYEMATNIELLLAVTEMTTGFSL